MNEAAASVAPRSGTARPGVVAAQVAYGRWVAMAVSASVAALLLMLALPRTVAAWAGMEGGDLYLRLAQNKKAADTAFDPAIAGLAYAVTWSPSSQRYAQLADLEDRRYWSLPSTDGRGAQMRRDAEAHAALAVAANPLDGESSLRLAMLRQWRGAPARDIAAPLLQSLDAAPNQRRLWTRRMVLVFSVWSVLSSEEQQVAVGQLRTVWRVAPELRSLMVQAAKAARQEPALDQALASDPGAAGELELVRAEALGRPRP
jgi:hypothetical protein